MADLNKVMLIGRLTRDPQLKHLPSQTAVCEFGFAVGRKFKAASGEMREETTFVDCTIFGRGAEVFHQYTTKGKQCFLEGRLKFDSWEDRQGGGKRSKLTVVVEDFQFLDSRGGNQGGGGEGGYEEGGRSAPPQRQSRSAPPRSAPQAAPEAPYGEEQQFSEDDIPF